MILYVILPVAAVLAAAALTVFFLLKDRPRAINPKAFKFTKEERIRFDRSNGLRLYKKTKNSLAVKSIGIMAALFAVSVILTVVISVRKHRFDHLSILSLIPAVIFLVMLIHNIIVFLKPDPVALTVGKVADMRLVKSAEGREGQFLLKVILRTGGQVVAKFPSAKKGRANNEEGIKTGDVCFVFVASTREIYVAAIR